MAVLNLPKTGRDVKPGTRCRVAGWGLANNQRPAPDRLREVNVTVIDRRTCNDPQHYNYNPVIGLNMLCAGNARGGKDSCNVSTRGPRPPAGSRRPRSRRGVWFSSNNRFSAGAG